MKYRKMGSLGWEVSALGFGAMRLPARNINRLRADKKESLKLIRHGIDLGINYLDTAWFYHLGDSEKIIGEALKGGYRDKVKLVTKLPIQIIRKEEEFDSYLARQLKRLQVDHIDGYLFHGLNRGTLRKAEKVRFHKKDGKGKGQGPYKPHRFFIS